jgi:quinol monooxygenase YgiN
MYRLIGKIRSVPGQRDALASILIQTTSVMPGCLSYVVALDASEADALWVTEVWDSAASHRASLSLPSVQEAISRAKHIRSRLRRTLRDQAHWWLRVSRTTSLGSSLGSIKPVEALLRSHELPSTP